MPEELTLRNDKIKSLFGFPDRLLGHHIERAYQALALNEHRADFVSASKRIQWIYSLGLNRRADRIVHGSSKPMSVGRKDKYSDRFVNLDVFSVLD